MSCRLRRGLSLRFGLRLAAVSMSDGALAIDVDNPRTKSVAETILQARAALLPQGEKRGSLCVI